jgi:hypothetical protein
MAEDNGERDGWPLDLLRDRAEIRAELAEREAELTERRSRYPAGQSGPN